MCTAHTRCSLFILLLPHFFQGLPSNRKGTPVINCRPLRPGLDTSAAPRATSTLPTREAPRPNIEPPSLACNHPEHTKRARRSDDDSGHKSLTKTTAAAQHNNGGRCRNGDNRKMYTGKHCLYVPSFPPLQAKAQNGKWQYVSVSTSLTNFVASSKTNTLYTHNSRAKGDWRHNTSGKATICKSKGSFSTSTSSSFPSEQQQQFLHQILHLA